MNKHHRTLELDRVLEMLAEQATRGQQGTGAAAGAL